MIQTLIPLLMQLHFVTYLVGMLGFSEDMGRLLVDKVRYYK